MNGPMKAFVGKTTFTGGLDEDLYSYISVFATLSKMFEVSNEKILCSLPVMLSGDALSYFSSNANLYTTYGDAITVLRK